MERKITFLNTFAGMLPVAAILIVCLSGGSVLSNFYTQANAQATWMQFVWMALIACAIAVSVRAKGPDFSVLSVMGLCMWIVGVCTVQGYGIVAGLIAALLAGAGIGALNGVAVRYTKLPAWGITLVTGVIVGVICTFLPYQALRDTGTPLVGMSHVGAAAFFAPAAAAVFLLVILTRLKIPFAQRDRTVRPVVYLVAYIVSGALAALAGVLLFSRLVVVVPPAAFSFGNILFLLFVTAGIYASRAFDNGIFPVLYALALAAVWVLLGIVMNLFSIASFPQIFVQLLLAAGMVVLAYFTSERKKRKKL